MLSTSWLKYSTTAIAIDTTNDSSVELASFLIDATKLILGKIIRWYGSKFPIGDAWSYYQLNEYR
jgi:hypothetical protein